MTWEFILLSKPAFRETNALTLKYQTRLKRDVSIESIFLKNEERLQAHIRKSAGLNILLDETGQSVDSISLSKKMQGWRNGPHDRIRFCVGDSYGFSDEVRAQADWLWKLSDLTLPGDFAWLLLWEQIFRGFSIIHKSGYHHG